MKEFLTTFFSELGISVTSLTVTEEADDISIRIETPDSPLLIGQHGKNIEAFQHLIGRVAEKKIGRFIHVHLEVNDYMKAKDDRLFGFLDGKITWVMQSGKSTSIKNLSSFERKKAHHYISEKKIEGLSTKSEGEGENRVLILDYTGKLLALTESTSSPHIKTQKVSSDLDLLSEDGVGI